MNGERLSHKDWFTVDTNVVVYAYDVAAREKHELAMEWLVRAWGQAYPVLLKQVLAEFNNVLCYRKVKPVQALQALNEDLLTRFHLWDYSVDDVLTASANHAKWRTTFWDALIAATCLSSGIKTLVTENERDFKGVPGLKVVNPFK